MASLLVIHVNGPINSGKTTIYRALARVLPDARFIDGDDHDAPDDAPLHEQWAIALERIVSRIAHACAFSDCFVDTSSASADAYVEEIARRAALPAA